MHYLGEDQREGKGNSEASLCSVNTALKLGGKVWRQRKDRPGTRIDQHLLCLNYTKFCILGN